MHPCREVVQYERQIVEAEGKSRNEWPLPGQRGYWAGVAEAAKISAHKSTLAHKLGKCTCQIRAYLERQKNRQNSSKG